jgi:protein-disulfide isomerase
MASSSGQNAAAAAILGLCLLGAAFLIARSLDHATQELTASLSQIETALAEGGPPARPAPARQARRTGPDPGRVYEIPVDGAPARGPEDAAVTVVEFSDFQCPFCARVHPTLEQVRKQYPDQVRIVYKHLPLSMHPKAPGAAAAAEAARLQGKFWEMHDRIFENQAQMSEDKYVEWAGEMGLDVDRFKKDLHSPAVKARVDADARQAAALGVTGTPAFFVNGRYLSGARPFADFKRLIDAELAKG